MCPATCGLKKPTIVEVSVYVFTYKWLTDWKEWTWAHVVVAAETREQADAYARTEDPDVARCLKDRSHARDAEVQFSVEMKKLRAGVIFKL